MTLRTPFLFLLGLIGAPRTIGSGSLTVSVTEELRRVAPVE